MDCALVAFSVEPAFGGTLLFESLAKTLLTKARLSDTLFLLSTVRFPVKGIPVCYYYNRWRNMNLNDLMDGP
ncbi:hypothetical protein GCM10010525_04450 [Glutamicibacter bergerei]|nr:hypothetical protein [Micrococcaceae bacterium]